MSKMRKEKPEPSPMWVWLESTLSGIFGQTAWQYHARKALEVRGGQLRVVADAAISEKARRSEEDMIARYLKRRAIKAQQKADELQRQADAAAATADSLALTCRQRRFAVERADKDRHLSECDAIVDEMYAWAVYVGDIEEAA